jgi:flagellar basal body P-ring formation protein FlgA
MIAALLLHAVFVAPLVVPAEVVVPAGPVQATVLAANADLSPTVLRRLKSVSLGSAPAAGAERILGGRYLRRLLSAAGVKGAKVPEQVVLRGASSVLKGSVQLAAIRADLARRLGSVGEITEVTPMGNLADLNVPPGARIGRLQPNGRSFFRNVVTYRLDVYAGQRRIATHYPRVRVAGAALVGVTAGAVRRGELLSADRVRFERRPLNTLPQAALTRRFNPVGKLAKSGLRSGAVLTPALVAEPPVVLRGKSVRIEVVDDLVQITTAGEALSDGAVGDRVAVRNRRSGARMNGVVVGPGRVRVSL